MKREFQIIFEKLRKKEIFVKIKSLKKHASQGYVSTVYSIDSNQGELILHLTSPNPEWKRLRIWEKIKRIGDLLVDYPDIPTTKVFLSGKVGNKYFIIQNKILGEPAGKRFLSEINVKDKWIDNKSKTLVPKIQKIIANVHTIKCKGYGWPIVRKGKLQGKYKNWKQFFEKEIPIWLQSIKNSDTNLPNKKELTASLGKAKKYTEKFLEKIPSAKSALIHGDAINPGNLLVKNGNITGLLDWEWSIIGDPAWEFCDPGWWSYLNEISLFQYFTETKKYTTNINEKEFIQKVKLYIPIWIMWGCHLHSDVPKGKLYILLRKMLAQSLK